jgi:hypothetical protein
MPTHLVQLSRPALADVTRTHWKVEVQSLVVGGFADTAIHLAGAKFRLAAHRLIDWNAPSTDTIIEAAPTVGPHTHRVWWQCSPFATHVAVVFGYQAYSASGTPKITATLKKRSGADIDADGVAWTVGNGGLAESRSLLRIDGVTPVYRYPILYTSTTGRIVDPGEIAGETGPRLLNVGTEAGNEIMVEAVVDWGRLHLIVGIEAFAESITQ